MSLVNRFAGHWQRLGIPPAGAVVAVSGGADSVALLDLLVRTRADHGLTLTVGHVDHGIHPDSATVALGVARLAESMAVPCRLVRLDLGPSASETTARAARHAALQGIRRDEGARWLVLAHHGDDQSETVLMRVLKGSGPVGLAGMGARRGTVIRPLLPFRRTELVQHLHDVGHSWWEDPANADERHLRSWLRRTVMPGLRDRFPRLDADLVGVASHARVQRSGWDAVLGQLSGLDWRAEEGGCSVAAGVLGDYDTSLGVCLLQALGRRVGCHVGTRRAERALAFVRLSQSGRCFEVGKGWVVEAAFGRAYLVRRTAPSAGDAVSLTTPMGEARWGDWSLRWKLDRAPAAQPRGGLRAWFDADRVVVRAARRGERIRPLGAAGRRTVARCLQEARVPRFRRAGWPVLEIAGEVVWVPGVVRSAAALPGEGMEAVRVDVEQH